MGFGLIQQTSSYIFIFQMLQKHLEVCCNETHPCAFLRMDGKTAPLRYFTFFLFGVLTKPKSRFWHFSRFHLLPDLLCDGWVVEKVFTRFLLSMGGAQDSCYSGIAVQVWRDKPPLRVPYQTPLSHRWESSQQAVIRARLLLATHHPLVILCLCISFSLSSMSQWAPSPDS